MSRRRFWVVCGVIGGVMVLVMGLFVAVLRVSAVDVVRTVDWYDHDVGLELEMVQPSKTHGLWVRYTVVPDERDEAGPFVAHWYVWPWRGVSWR